MIVKVNIAQDLGYGLTLYMAQLGWALYQDHTGMFVCENGEPQPERPVELDEEGQPLPLPPLELPEVQALIDNYNSWPYEKSVKLAEINAWFESAVSRLTAGTTQAERDSWAVQVNEAYGIRPVAMLAAMAAARGISVDELIQRVKAKAEAFAAYYGALQGRRDAMEDQVKAFPDAGELGRLPDLWAIKCTD